MFRYAIRRRHWPFYLLLALATLAGVALWAYSPALPPDMLVARYANDKSEFIDVAGAHAHVRDQGDPDGIPLVLIHGAGGSLHVWEGWVRELGSKARLISVDLPGHGLTGAWPRQEYTVKAYADFIEALVDTLHLDRFVLVGHSLGGGVAWTFAATRPDRVSQIILIDAAGESREPAWPTRLARLPIVGEIGIYFRPERWVRRKLTEAYADPAMVTPERLKRTAELQRFPGNREATLLRARTQEPLDTGPLKRLTVATLILWGARDPMGACRRRLPIQGRHQDHDAQGFRQARPRSHGGRPGGYRRRRCRLPEADPVVLPCCAPVHWKSARKRDR